MAKKKDKTLRTEPAKKRKQSVEELKERKRFMLKMAVGTIALFAVLAAIIIPISLLLY